MALSDIDRYSRLGEEGVHRRLHLVGRESIYIGRHAALLCADGIDCARGMPRATLSAVNAETGFVVLAIEGLMAASSMKYE